jgi:hypothetical protein
MAAAIMLPVLAQCEEKRFFDSANARYGVESGEVGEALAQGQG